MSNSSVETGLAPAALEPALAPPPLRMEVSAELKAGFEAAPHALTARRAPLNALTGIRFFAAYLVVVFHSRFSQLCMDHHLVPLGNFFANGFLAVPLFFILSGFILSYTYAGQIARKGDHRRFWEARFARIWPVYALSLVCASIPAFSFPPLGPALATVAMVQAWNPFFPGLAGTWNFVCWTLSVEAFFYLVFPWVQVWLERRGPHSQLGWIGAMLTISLAINSAASTLGALPTGALRYVPLPVIHLPEFFVGVGLGNYFLKALAAQRTSPKRPLLPGRGLWTYLAALVSLTWLCVPAGALTSVIVVCFALLVYGLAAERTLLSRFLSTPFLLLGGGISYSVYLMQIPVKIWVNLTLAYLHITSTTLHLLLTFGVLTVVSLMLFKGVEDPARKLLRGVFARLEERREITRA